MSKTEFDVFCPECNMFIAAKVVAEGNGGYRSNAISPSDESDAEYYGEHYIVCLCGRCSQPFFIRQSLFGFPGEFETVREEEVLYPIGEKLPLDGVPTTIRLAHDQAVRSYSASLYEPTVLMCRKSLEAICKTLGAKGRDLNARLQTLRDDGHIDSRLLNWAHEIRLIGNEAAHDLDIKPITSSKAGGLNRNRSKRFGLLGPVKQAEFV